ncbi:NUDIX hydrolase [Novispirillum itersonii]|uniref:Nudix hydrolase domain-containing protein n=1 Tax=Novispirillum itersonii TaxID=189 RepID=A0A7W9ZFD3_NOVIT|nr:NUDIX domain-containing protein [Novispirillum itersonii]MBB6209264.1 hypothetical protein [Novispirillum itersonii]
MEKEQKGYRFTAFSSPVIIRERPAVPLSSFVQEKVDALWQEAQQCREEGRLMFDGRVYALAELSDTEVIIEERRYREFFAARLDPSLPLAVVPLGVMGGLTCPEGLVIGRRGAFVSLYPGLWEVAPSGTLDSVSPRDVLIRECQEELLLEGDEIICGNHPIGVMCADGIYDFVYKIETEVSIGELKLRVSRNDQEYSDLSVISPCDLLVFPHKKFIPHSAAMIRDVLGENLIF